MLKNNSNKFVYSEVTSDKKGLHNSLLNKNIDNGKYQIFIRESSVKHRYEVYVSKVENKFNYIYNTPRATATKVFEIAKRYNIKLR